MAESRYPGSRIMTVRVPDDLIERISAAISRTNKHTAREPYTFSSWVKAAIEDKLAHLKRSSGRSSKKKLVKEFLDDSCKEQ